MPTDAPQPPDKSRNEIRIEVSPEMDALIDEYCRYTKISKTDFMREAAIAHLQNRMGLDYIWTKLREKSD